MIRMEREVKSMNENRTLQSNSMTNLESRVSILETEMIAVKKRVTDLEKSLITIKGILRI